MLNRLADKAGVFWDKLKQFIKQPRVKRAGAALFLFLSLMLLIVFQFYPERVSLKAGEVAPRTVKAPRSAVFEDEAKTEELRREAASKVPKIYDIDPKVLQSIKRDITKIIGKVITASKEPHEDKGTALKEALPFSLPEGTIRALLETPEPKLRQLERELIRIVEQVMADGVRQEDLAQARRDVSDRINLLSLEPAEKALAQAINRHTLRPNKFYDAARTEMLQKEAAAAVEPVEITVRAGEKIIGEGEVVTAEHIAKLNAVGLYHARPPFGALTGVALVVLLLTAALFYYIYQQRREVYLEPAYLYLIALVIVSVLLVAKIILAIDVRQGAEISSHLGYAIPVATAGMLLAILLDSRIAAVAVVITAILTGMMTGNDLRFALAGFLTGITGVYSVSRLSRRGDLVRAGLYVSAAAAMASLAVGLMSEIPFRVLLPVSLGFGLVNGLLSSILTNGALPVLESLSGITSPVRLLELTDPGEPLLRRLLMEAPGTYHHSIIVGNLGEAAAEAIGADVLTVRTGAYYHDIGKLRRPYFFVENQMGQDNPHDKLAPTLSTLIVTNHVKDGAEIAREYKLPRKIIDIIEQHHGTSMVGFFYQKALEGNQKDAVAEKDFRYPGPKPQTREAAIVMLADAVEAAVRSADQLMPGQVEGLVRRIIKDKLQDGQLEECALTFRDLGLIAGAFARVLSGIFHNRLEYPREAGKEEHSDGDSSEPANEGAGHGQAHASGAARG
ncbi:MAG TPA: HDIG domain-containing protein [Desulfotomaculum sp.]|nr:HDIG domain-containing protein [Desulfotomaculum sp.]